MISFLEHKLHLCFTIFSKPLTARSLVIGHLTKLLHESSASVFSEACFYTATETSEGVEGVELKQHLKTVERKHTMESFIYSKSQ